MTIPELWKQAEEMVVDLLKNTKWPYRKIAHEVHKKYGVGRKSWIGDVARKYGLRKK